MGVGKKSAITSYTFYFKSQIGEFGLFGLEKIGYNENIGTQIMNLLNFEATKAFLVKYNIPLIESQVIIEPEQGIQFAHNLGWPVVLKFFSCQMLHKFDAGFVRLNIKNEMELKAAFQDFKRDNPTGEVLIQETACGTEIFCGMKRDVTFGPFLIFGLGGIFVEVLDDLSFGLAPLGRREATQMIREIKGYKILKGYRGNKPLFIDGIADILLNVSAMATNESLIKEIDFNPIFVDEKNAVVVDAKILV